VRYFRTSRLLFHPISAPERRDPLEILDGRFGRCFTLVAYQVPVNEWFQRFPDPTLAGAILDRIIQNAYRLNLSGDSQRKVHSGSHIGHLIWYFLTGVNPLFFF
jgi:DNA replication protein DnaC